MALTTREQDRIVERIADTWGSAVVTPLRDGTGNIVVQGLVHDDILMGEPLCVTPEGASRVAAPHERSRARKPGGLLA